MALRLVEVPIQFIPIGVDRLQVTVNLPTQTVILGLLQDPRSGPRVLTRQDPGRPLQPVTVVALQAGADLVQSDQNAEYIGSFEGYYRSIPQAPPAEGEPAPPPILKKEIYHMFRLTVASTLPATHTAAEFFGMTE